jgi:hypothetical protein
MPTRTEIEIEVLIVADDHDQDPGLGPENENDGDELMTMTMEVPGEIERNVGGWIRLILILLCLASLISGPGYGYRDRAMACRGVHQRFRFHGWHHRALALLLSAWRRSINIGWSDWYFHSFPSVHCPLHSLEYTLLARCL